MKKKEKINYTVPILFLLYLALLIWIILFKLQFSILDLDRVREINLIPFYYEHEVTFHATEVLQNVLIFMPFGIYLCLLLPKSRFGVKVLLISVVSLLLEICQYVLAIGRSDITDLITNICGGLFGIILYKAAIRLFRNKKTGRPSNYYFSRDCNSNSWWRTAALACGKLMEVKSIEE